MPAAPQGVQAGQGPVRVYSSRAPTRLLLLLRLLSRALSRRRLCLPLLFSCRVLRGGDEEDEDREERRGGGGGGGGGGGERGD